LRHVSLTAGTSVSLNVTAALITVARSASVVEITSG
jgi:hypothetical protein